MKHTESSIAAFIREHPFFLSLDPAQLQFLTEGAREETFDRDDLLFKQGDPANRLFLLKEGTILLEASCHGHCDARARVEVLGPGEVLGWSWLVPPFSWNLQARALTPGSVIVLDGARLLVECESDPILGYRLMKRIAQLIAHRVQSLREQLVEEEIHRHDKHLAPA